MIPIDWSCFIFNENKILLGRRDDLWVLPSDTLDSNKDINNKVVKRIKEKTNLDVHFDYSSMSVKGFLGVTEQQSSLMLWFYAKTIIPQQEIKNLELEKWSWWRLYDIHTMINGIYDINHPQYHQIPFSQCLHMLQKYNLISPVVLMNQVML